MVNRFRLVCIAVLCGAACDISDDVVSLGNDEGVLGNAGSGGAGGIGNAGATSGGMNLASAAGIRHFLDAGIDGRVAGTGATGTGGTSAGSRDAGHDGGGAARGEGGVDNGAGEGGTSNAPEGGSTRLALAGVSYDGVNWRSVRIDLATGELTTLAALAHVDTVTTGVTAFDANTERMYTLVFFEDGTRRLIGVDVSTGTLVTSPVVSLGLLSIEADATGALVGIRVTPTVYGQPSDYDFVTVDSGTGAIRSIAPLPTVSSPYQGMSTIDIRAGRYYHLVNALPDAQQGDPWTVRLIGVDVATGNVVVDTITSAPVLDIQVAQGGSLVGLTVTEEGGPWRFCAVDVETGVVTQLASFDVPPFSLGISAMDAASSRHYQHTYSSETGAALIGFDLASATVSVLPLERQVTAFVPAVLPGSP